MLDSKQRSHLSSLSNKMEPSAALGRDGLTDAVVAHLDRELAIHELVKLRFSDFKGERADLAAQLAEKCGAELVRVLGNTALIFRRNPDPAQRIIRLPGDKTEDFPPKKALMMPRDRRKPEPGGTKNGPRARALKAMKKSGPRKIPTGPRPPKRER